MSSATIEGLEGKTKIIFMLDITDRLVVSGMRCQHNAECGAYTFRRKRRQISTVETSDKVCSAQ
jgi:hypothetical protein